MWIRVYRLFCCSHTIYPNFVFNYAATPEIRISEEMLALYSLRQSSCADLVFFLKLQFLDARFFAIRPFKFQWLARQGSRLTSKLWVQTNDQKSVILSNWKKHRVVQFHCSMSCICNSYACDRSFMLLKSKLPTKVTEVENWKTCFVWCNVIENRNKVWGGH